MGQPTIYPTGTTRYDADKAYNGYTLITNDQAVGAVLVDMRGNVVRHWKDLMGFPNKMIRGGYVFGNRGVRDSRFGYQDRVDLIQVDWDGNVVWEFNKKEYIEDEGQEPQWMARQHHDFQRAGNPVGYYVPGMESETLSGNTLILCHETVEKPRISPYPLIDDVFIEVDWEGNILWQWNMSDHINELGLSDVAKLAMYRNPNLHESGGGMGDFAHINCMSELGPNKWYDQGDERFNPKNIIFDSREINFMAIISKETGKIVWQMGPDFGQSDDKMDRRFGQIVGPHHTHMVPQGLPGEGNILVFDNGGFSGYGAPDNLSKDGLKVNKIDRSRVIEFDPITKKVVWEFVGSDMENYGLPGINDYRFYSPLTSSAQRLPNGNTFITEGVGGRLLEVTPEKEIVWEYVAPFGEKQGYIYYRAYRYPYDYVPQVEAPVEESIPALDVRTFRVPGAAEGAIRENNTVTVEGTWGYPSSVQACVAADDEDMSLKKSDDDEEESLFSQF